MNFLKYFLLEVYSIVKILVSCLYVSPSVVRPSSGSKQELQDQELGKTEVRERHSLQEQSGFEHRSNCAARYFL